MKKILFSIIALMAVMTVQAQSICATWRTLQPVVESNYDDSFSAQSFTYTFYSDGTYTLVDELTQATEPSQTMALEVASNITIKGTYTLDGNKLTLIPNKDSYKTELINISRNGRVVNDSKVKSSTISKLNNKDFKAQFTGRKDYTVRVGEASLEMNDGAQALNYMRLATIKQ